MRDFRKIGEGSGEIIQKAKKRPGDMRNRTGARGIPKVLSVFVEAPAKVNVALSRYCSDIQVHNYSCGHERFFLRKFPVE
jgi:hypothetical protein